MIRRIITCILLFLVFVFSHSAVCESADDRIYMKEMDFTSVGTNAYSSLKQITPDVGSVIFYWTVESSASIDYDVHFFTERIDPWSSVVDTKTQVYKRAGITLSWYYDDIVFPLVDTSTAKTGTKYTGIFNDDNSNTSNFTLNVYWYNKPFKER